MIVRWRAEVEFDALLTEEAVDEVLLGNVSYGIVAAQHLHSLDIVAVFFVAQGDWVKSGGVLTAAPSCALLLTDCATCVVGYISDPFRYFEIKGTGLRR